MIDSPIAVFNSKMRGDSLVVPTRMIDRENNEKAVVAIHLHKSQGGRTLKGETAYDCHSRLAKTL